MVARTLERLSVIDEIKNEIVDEIAYDMAESDEGAGMTPKQLGRKCGLAQSDVSDLLNRKLKRFTVDRLLMILVALGHRPRVNVC